MTDRVATTTGLYPHPDQASGTVEQSDDQRNQEDGPKIETGDGSYSQSRERVIADQHEAELDRVVEGQLRWDDLLAHPLAVAEGVEPTVSDRYYDDDAVYRRPRVTDSLAATGAVGAELSAAGDHTAVPLQAVLPGPYTLSRLATDAHYGEGAFLPAVADFLAEEIGRFPNHETLLLLEPSLATDPPDEGVDARASDAIDTVAAATAADVLVHTYFGAIPEKPYAHLLDADIDALGVDLVDESRGETLYNITEYGTTDEVALGVVDGQTPSVETPATVLERVDWFEERIPRQTFDRTYLLPNTELCYLPTDSCRGKLAALGAAVV